MPDTGPKRRNADTTVQYERSTIGAISGYIPGRQPASDRRIAKLNANENPFPPAAAVREALAAIDVDRLRFYPSATADEFRESAAKLHDVDPSFIMAVNGGDELLRLAIQTFVDPGAAIGVTSPCYALYRVLAAINGSPLATVDVWPNGILPARAAATINRAGARLTFLSNPHAPIGTLVDADRIAAFARELDGVLLVDEAYVDFVDPALGHSLLPLVKELDNLILLRSLSKGYSLAGIRFGYAVASPSLIAPMILKTRDSYNVDTVAQTLAVAALAGRAEAVASCAIVSRERDKLVASLTQLGFDAPATQTSFLLIRPGGGREGALALFRFLEARGILVRHFDEAPIDDRLRISIGTIAENKKLLDALKEFSAQRRASS